MACGSSTPKGADEPVAPSSSADAVTAADASASGATAAAADSAPAPQAAQASAAPVEECAALKRFPASAYVPADDPKSGKKTVVPWMEDPMGERVPPPKKGGKAKPKKDPHLDELRGKFRKCVDLARQLDTAQTTALSFEHKPKGGDHQMCVRVQRDEGRPEVTKDLARCMLDAIQEWAQKAP